MDDQSTPIKFNPLKGSYYRSERTERPTGSPKTEKDFKKIYNNGDDTQQSDADEPIEVKTGDEEGPEETVIAFNTPGTMPTKSAERTASPATPFELFANTSTKKSESTKISTAKNAPAESLAYTTKKPEAFENSPYQPVDKVVNKSEQAAADVPAPEEEEEESVYDDYERTANVAPQPPTDDSIMVKEEKPPQPIIIKTEHVDTASPILAKAEEPRFFVEKKGKTDNFNNQFTREQPDLSYVNPLAAPPPPIPIAAAEVKIEAPVPTTNLHALVEKLVKELSVIKQGDKTETSLVIDNPPQFHGMRIVITTYESANNQFNLKFENLTQAAKEILDLQQNRADLISNLERKGYNVHIFVTTTYTETTPLAENVETTTRDRERQGEGQQSSRERERGGKDDHAA